MKRMLALALALMMCLSVAVPVFATDAACPGKDKEHVKPDAALGVEGNCTSFTLIEVHAPTCEEAGYTTYQCDVCKDYFAGDIVEPDGKHNFVVTKEPTCYQAGEQVCTICEKVAPVKATGDHNWDWAGKDPNAVCIEGSTETVVGTCTNEGCEATKSVTLTGHIWGDVPTEIIKKPTCVPTVDPVDDEEETVSYEGLAEFTCKKCGETKEVVILPLDHHALVDVELVTPDCENDGIQMADGHEDEVIVKNGLKYGQKCTICGWTNVEVVEAKHTYNEEPDRVIYPTCTSWGYDFYGCTRCGDTYTVPHEPLNHKNAELLPGSTGAICGNKDGVDYYHCPDCGLDFNKKAPNFDEHAFETVTVDATCCTPDKTWNECKNCGMVEEGSYKEGKPNEELHNWQKAETGHRAPTCRADGWDRYECVNEGCTATEDRTVAKLGHTYDDDGDGIWDIDGEILPLCGDDGQYIYICSRCNWRQYALGQLFDPANPVHHGKDRPDISQDHLHEYTEADLDEIMTEIGNELWSSRMDATCTETGVAYYRCDTCSNKTDGALEQTIVWFEYVIPAKGHRDVTTGKVVYGNSIDVYYPTKCGETLVVDSFDCVDCDLIDFAGGTYTATCGDVACAHKMAFADGVACGTVGDMICTCTIEVKDEAGEVVDTKACAHVVEDVLRAHAHGVYTYTLEDPKKPGTFKTYTAVRDNDCENYGFRYMVCAVCGDEYVDQYEYATGHNVQEILPDLSTEDPYDFVVKGAKDAGKLWLAPTCTESGLKITACVNEHASRVLKDGEVVLTLCQFNKVCKKTDEGKEDCNYYGPYWTEEVVAPLGHLDEFGHVIKCVDSEGKPIIENVTCYRDCCCTDKTHVKEDGMCAIGHEIDWKTLHDWSKTYVKGTCIYADYTLWVCNVCQYNYVENGFQFGEHDFTGAYKVDLAGNYILDADGNKIPDFSNTRWTVQKEATYTEPGLKVFPCNKCNGKKGEDAYAKAIYTLTDIKFTLATDSGIKAGADIVNSGKLFVTVQASAYDIDLFSIDLNINYDATKLVFTGYKVSDYLKALIGESGVEVGAAVENNIGIYMANNGKVPTDVKMSKVDKVALVTLEFDVKADVNDATTGVSYTTLTILDDVSVLKANGTDKVETNLENNANKVTIQTLGNVTMGNIESSKTRVDDFDGRAMVSAMMVPNHPYLATADINKDGKVDLVDYAALAKYIAAGCTYDELCATGIAD